MNAKTGFEAWREQNLRLPFPSEFRIKPDGSLKAIWRNLERGWYSLYVDFTWDADGTEGSAPAQLRAGCGPEAVFAPDRRLRVPGRPRGRPARRGQSTDREEGHDGCVGNPEEHREAQGPHRRDLRVRAHGLDLPGREGRTVAAADYGVIRDEDLLAPAVSFLAFED